MLVLLLRLKKPGPSYGAISAAGAAAGAAITRTTTTTTMMKDYCDG
jgi:hypothetical protein